MRPDSKRIAPCTVNRFICFVDESIVLARLPPEKIRLVRNSVAISRVMSMMVFIG